jgi:small subunit ribosomal protein S27Ae
MAKRKVKNKIPSKKYGKYRIEGNKIVRAKFCPKCGEGVFMAQHRDRWYCGKCHYLETK